MRQLINGLRAAGCTVLCSPSADSLRSADVRGGWYPHALEAALRCCDVFVSVRSERYRAEEQMNEEQGTARLVAAATGKLKLFGFAQSEGPSVNAALETALPEHVNDAIEHILAACRPSA